MSSMVAAPRHSGRTARGAIRRELGRAVTLVMLAFLGIEVILPALLTRAAR